MADVHLAILGPLEISRDGVDLPITGARVRLLLGRLALDAGHPVSVHQLADAVWGLDSPTDATNALQALVSRARRALGSAEALRIVPGGYQLEQAGLDAAEFAELVTDGRTALGAGRHEEAAQYLSQALQLWRGEVLDGAEFAQSVSTRLQELRLSALEDLAEADLGRGRRSDVIARLEELVELHPRRERIVSLLMSALHAAGRTADALGAYARIRELLADELGADPSARLQQQHLELLRAPVPQTRHLPAVRRQLTSFIGRAEELRRLITLGEQSRLITLIGPGGAGKTRLAQELTAVLAEESSDDIWFVELAGLTAAADLAPAVLAAFGARESRLIQAPREVLSGLDHIDPVDKLVVLLDGRHTVLVLDNCEHLIDASAELVDQLLSSSPGLRIVTTSREALGLIGETVYPVKTLVNSQAIELFADRARAARPDLVLDAEATAVAAEICQRLDGLPLAIELAAARLRTMPLTEIAARLDDRFRLLTGGSRTALPRHRTLKAVVEWSWALLSEQERNLIEELVVFTGGFDFQAAEAVHRAVGGDGELLEILTSLVEKSLIALDSGRVGRYRMLETIREFGRDRLAERGALGSTRAAHANYFAGLAEETEPKLNAREQLEAMATLKTERDNLFAALTFLAEAGEASAALDLATRMSWYSMLLGSRTTAAAWLDTALAAEGETTVEQRAAAAIFQQINELSMGWTNSDMERLSAAYDELARTPAQEQEPKYLMLRVMARMFMTQAIPRPVTDPTEPDRELERLITIGMQQEHPWSRATMLLVRASMAENAGEFAVANEAAEQSILQFEELGDRWGLGGSYETVARLRMHSGDLEGAKAALEQSYRYLNELGAQEDAASSMLWLAIAQLRGGEYTEAVTTIGRIDDFPEAMASPELQAIRAYVSAEVARLGPDTDWDTEALNAQALELLGGAEGGGGAPQLLALVLTQEALTAIPQGRLADAERALRTAGSRAGQLSDMPIFAGFVLGLAVLEAAKGNHRQAAVLLGCSEVIRGAADEHGSDERAARAAIAAAIGADELATATAAGFALGRRRAVTMVVRSFLDPASADPVTPGPASQDPTISDPAAVGPDGQREEDGQQTDHPQQAVQDR